jgi:hypothetical protein
MKFFAADWFVGNEALRHQEPVCGDAQIRMMVESSPAPSLVVAQAEVLLQVLVVTLDAPALMSGTDQFVDRGFFGQRRKDVLARLLLMGGPLHEQPL